VLIGDVAAASGVSARMLRHYDRVGLLSPAARTAAGYREYGDADLERLFHIEGLRSLGLSLTQVREVIREGTFPPERVIAELIARTEDRIARAREVVRRLETVRGTAPRSWSEVLRAVELVRGLDSPAPSGRQSAALRLAGSEDGQTAMLVHALLAERNEDAAGAMQWVLSRIGDAAVAPLAAALHSDDPQHRRRALDALVKIGTPLAREAITAADPRGDDRIRVRATLARAEDADPAVIPDLVALVRDGLDDVAAADALADLAHRVAAESAAVAEIVAAVRGGDVSARRRLAAALGGISGAAATGALTALLADDDRGTSLTAKALLATRGGS
jgi:DNA-binding transcriptional MerR regulator